MSRIKKYAIWFYMYSKRLLHKVSFVILMCLIPVVVLAASVSLQGNSGILKVVLCNTDSGSAADEITKSLLERDSVIYFEEKSNPDEAARMVETGEADAAWVFMPDFDARLEGYGTQKSAGTLVEVIQRGESVALQLSREVLFGAIFKESAYYTYKKFVHEEIVGPESVTEAELKQFYNAAPRGDAIVRLRRLNSDAPVEQQNILTSPLRGLLSLLVMLCTMAAALYFLQDQADGKYSWLQPKMRMAPAFASCMAAALFSGLAVFVALALSGVFTNIVTESVAMLLFMFMATGFCMLLAVIFRSPGRFGAMIPGLVIVMLALSPIFFDMKTMKVIRLMLPTCGYLNAVYNPDYMLYNVLYCIGIYVLVFVLNAILNRDSAV